MGVRSRVIPGHAWRGRRSGLLDFPLRFWTSATATWRLARLIGVCDVDVVCTWTLGVPAGAFAARLTRRPHVWYAHEPVVRDDMRGLLPGWAWLRSVERLSERVVSPSPVIRAQFGTGPTGRHVIVPNQLRPDVVATPGLPQRRPDAPRLAVIGTVAPHKRTIDAVRAFSIVRGERPGATLQIWGDGPAAYVAQVREEARRLDLDGSVRFNGFEPDPRIFLAADLVLHPAEHEAFGLAVLEAMSVGIPVVAARSQGVSDLVGEDGAVLVAVGDWEAMGHEAARILGDDERYRERALAAGARARTVVAGVDGSAHADVLRAVLASRQSREPRLPLPTERGST
jgi:glycosyltransferase involved in cell wall biosynthesis